MGYGRGARDGVFYNRAVTQEFITYYDREGELELKVVAMHFEFVRFCRPPVDFSSVINFQTSHRRL